MGPGGAAVAGRYVEKERKAVNNEQTWQLLSRCLRNCCDRGLWKLCAPPSAPASAAVRLAPVAWGLTTPRLGRYLNFIKQTKADSPDMRVRASPMRRPSRGPIVGAGARARAYSVTTHAQVRAADPTRAAVCCASLPRGS